MANEEPEILMPSDGRPSGEFVSQPAKLLRIAAMIRELLEEVRKSSPDEGGDSGQDTGDEAAPCEGSHQRSASGGVPTTRYIQTAPSRKKPVVDAAKQSR